MVNIMIPINRINEQAASSPFFMRANKDPLGEGAILLLFEQSAHSLPTHKETGCCKVCFLFLNGGSNVVWCGKGCYKTVVIIMREYILMQLNSPSVDNLK